MVALLQTQNLDRGRWRAFLSKALSEPQVPEVRGFLWAAQMKFDPAAALSRLESSLPSEGGTDDTVVDVLGTVWDWIDDIGIVFEWGTTELQRLYVVLVRLRREGEGHFSPIRRLRGNVVDRLIKAGRPGREVFEQLAAMSQEPFREMRDFHLAAANRAAIGDPSATPMSRLEAVRWVRECEADPSTASGLFELVKARIADIATFLRAHPFSYSGLFSDRGSSGTKDDKQAEERFFQLWLAAELEARSAARYRVIREEEERAQKRPDMRAHVPSATPTSVELKVAESWSVAELRKALADQLVGQYMGEVSSGLDPLP